MKTKADKFLENTEEFLTKTVKEKLNYLNNSHQSQQFDSSFNVVQWEIENLELLAKNEIEILSKYDKDVSKATKHVCDALKKAIEKHDPEMDLNGSHKKEFEAEFYKRFDKMLNSFGSHNYEEKKTPVLKGALSSMKGDNWKKNNSLSSEKMLNSVYKSIDSQIRDMHESIRYAQVTTANISDVIHKEFEKLKAPIEKLRNSISAQSDSASLNRMLHDKVQSSFDSMNAESYFNHKGKTIRLFNEQKSILMEGLEQKNVSSLKMK